VKKRIEIKNIEEMDEVENYQSIEKWKQPSCGELFEINEGEQQNNQQKFKYFINFKIVNHFI
jgi:hypothetical protein